jgi:anti-sigma regulatory factor (Ser/Thr protein kinase)
MAQLQLVLAERVCEGHLLGPRTLVGRSRDADLLLSDPSVSREHALIVQEGTRWIIEDRGSRAGVRVNGERTERATLQDGDVVQFGDCTCIFSLETTPPEAERRAVCDSPDALVADADWADVKDLEISMAGTRALLDAAGAALPALLDSSTLEAQERLRFAMAGQEALGNAWRHGNREDPAKRVVWRLIRDTHRVVLRVRDGGPGFDYRAALAIARESNPLEVARARYQAGRPGGLGIMMMVRGCDMVEFTRGGAEVCLVKVPARSLSAATLHGGIEFRDLGPTIEELRAARDRATGR